MKNKKELEKNKFGLSKEWLGSFSVSKKRGFIILIAIVVSSLLVSMGLFISNIAYKELQLSSSSQASQKAFLVADSVMECALRADIRGLVFDNAPNFSRSEDIEFSCNGKIFRGSNTGDSQKTEYGCYHSPQTTTCYSGEFIFYISLAESGLNTNSGLEGHVTLPASQAVKDAPYTKVIFTKDYIGDIGFEEDNPDLCPEDNLKCKDKTTIKVYGHNKYSGTGVVERALEARL
jgi:hypothetical protein